MIEMVYKVYALLDENKCIIGIESTAFYSENELLENDYIKVDEGSDGDIYGHAQPNYLKVKHGKPIYDEQMHCNFKLVDGVVIALTDEEKAILFPVDTTKKPTTEERISVMEDAVQELILMQLGAGGGE
ncbi:hypothetical protein MKC66_13160 [[Clostridium] innocuum]|nr:hypothetical protein [[Clostridium] innocuum]